MVKISVGLGMTLKMSTGSYNMFKPELLISDIEVLGADGSYDAEGIEMQVKAALSAADYSYSAAEGKMVDIIETSEVTEKKEVITEFRKQISDLQTQIKELSPPAVAVAKSSAVDAIDTESDTSEDVETNEDEEDW